MSDARQSDPGERTVEHKPRISYLRVALATGLLASAAMLAACGQVQPTPQESSEAASGTSGASRESVPPGDLTRPTQLALGTLKLEDTELAVSQEQGAQLAFLWQAYGSLTRSGTAAEQEITALVNQIEGAMSAEQLKAIGDMHLTRDEMIVWVEENGVRPEAAPGADGARGFAGLGPMPGMEGGAPGGGEGGRLPAGGPPGGGGMLMGPGGGEGAGGMSGGEGLAPEMQATLQASRPAAGAGDRLVLMLLNPLITLLNARAGG